MFSLKIARRGVVATVATALMVFSCGPAHAQSARELQTFQSFLDIVESYMGIIEASHSVNADDSKAAVAQLMKVKEIFDDQGDIDGAIVFFKRVLDKTQHRTIRNTAYSLMVDLLKEAERFDEAQDMASTALDESISALGN